MRPLPLFQLLIRRQVRLLSRKSEKTEIRLQFFGDEEKRARESCEKNRRKCLSQLGTGFAILLSEGILRLALTG
jgi:hypothetical protein